MPDNPLGDLVRGRRTDLGLSQEQLAARIGENTTQAEVSRLERGSGSLPRRERMERLAASLDMSLGEILIGSGWLTADEGKLVDALPKDNQQTTASMVVELGQMQYHLQIFMQRLSTLEGSLQNTAPPESHEQEEQPSAAEETRQ